MNASSVAPARDRSVDFIKTVAIFGVIVIHVTVPTFSAGEIGSPPWLTALFWAGISHASVPLFLMASGALLLPPEREMTLKKLYTKSIPRLLIALLFWAAGYKLFHMLAWGTFASWRVVFAVKEVLLFRHEDHLYYLLQYKLR